MVGVFMVVGASPVPSLLSLTLLTLFSLPPLDSSGPSQQR